MQLLFDRSSEYGDHPGLGLVPGEVTDLRADLEDPSLKVPHMGWNLSLIHISPDLPAGDALPTVYNVPRRLLARLFDYLLVNLALLAALCLAGYNPARANSLAISLGTTVLLGLLEPLCLRLFDATPGKALLGRCV